MTINIGGTRLGDEAQEYDQLQPTPTLSETLKAGYELGLDDTFVGSLGKRSALIDVEERTKHLPKIDPKELNLRFPDMPVPFDKPMNEHTASYLHDRFMERQKLQSKIARGVEGSGFRKALSFGAGIVPSALDPVEFTLGIVGGLGIQKAAQAISAGVKSSRAINIANKFAKGPIKSEFVGDLAANLAAEGLIVSQNKKEMRDYTVMDGFTNAVAGATISLAIKGVFKGMKRLGEKISESPMSMKRKIEVELDAKTAAEAHATAVNQKLAGQEVNVDPIVRRHQMHIDASPYKYEFRKMTSTEVPDKTFYYTSKGESIGDTKTYQVGEDFGDGVYFSDNQNIANGRGRSYRSVKFDQKVVNLMDADKPLPKDIQGKIERLIKSENMPKRPGQFQDAFTLREIYDGIKESNPQDAHNLINGVNDYIHDNLGFKGLRYVNEIDVKEKPQPTNAIMLFDKEDMPKLQKLRKHKHVPLNHEQKIAERKARAQLDEYTRQLDEEYRAIVNEGIREDVSADWTQRGSDIDTEFKAMEKQGTLSAETKSALEDLSDEIKKEKTLLQATKDMIACKRSGGN